MANATPSRVGQSLGAGAVDALWLKQFSGEILTAFRDTNIFEALHTTRTISGAKSAQFPATGIASAAYHTPGTEIVGSVIQHAERTILIDGLLISHAFIADWDDWINHYDVTSEYSFQLGAALARFYDKQVAQVIVKAARSAALLPGHYAGTVLAGGATVVSDSTVLSNQLWLAAQNMDEKKCADMERYCALSPALYYLMVRGAGNFLDKQFSSDNGDYAKGMIKTAAGLTLVKTINLPTTNVVANDALENNDYVANYTATKAICWAKPAVGTLKLKEIELQQQADVRRQGTLMVSRMSVGHGVLRPECAVEITNA